jgi:hypothetical protein
MHYHQYSSKTEEHLNLSIIQQSCDEIESLLSHQGRRPCKNNLSLFNNASELISSLACSYALACPQNGLKMVTSLL